MNYLESVNKLSSRELKLWNMIRNKSGIVMAYGIPGIAKSATFRTIAKKMNLSYIDFRATTIDETDLGVYPVVSDYNGFKVVEHAVPGWAIRANEKPTLIHFEELNRCTSNIRNAILGILLERIIGTNFTFNEHVYMVASGNPVCDYDQDVEEFGFALRNRLIPIQFTLTLSEWKNEFAKENVVNEVIGFLNAKPDFFGNTKHQMEKFIGENEEQYPSPRSWTFLSDYFKGFENDKVRKEAMKDINTIKNYVGQIAGTAFVAWINEFFKVSVEDVLKGKVDISTLDVMTVQRITEEFQETKKLHELTTAQLKNWKTFISHMSDEIRAAHIVFLMSNINKLSEIDKNKYFDTLKEYKKLIKSIANNL